MRTPPTFRRLLPVVVSYGVGQATGKFTQVTLVEALSFWQVKVGGQALRQEVMPVLTNLALDDARARCQE